MIGKIPFAIALVFIWLVMTSGSTSARRTAGRVRLGIPTFGSRTSLADLAGHESAVLASSETSPGGTSEENLQPTMSLFLGAAGLMMTTCVLLTRHGPR